MDGTGRKESIRKALAKLYGSPEGERILADYETAFEPSYYEECDPDRIAEDIESIEKLSRDNFLELRFYESRRDNETRKHLRLYRRDKFVPLSVMLPILGNFGFQVWTDRTYHVVGRQGTVWIGDFVISYMHSEGKSFDNEGPLFCEALKAIGKELFVSDPLNELILTIGVPWREISVLRGYIKYLLQTNFHFSESYIEKTLVRHPSIARKLIDFFLLRHDPSKQSSSPEEAAKIENALSEELLEVKSLDDDTIVRQLLALLKATLRTNFFQKTSNGEPHSFISFKLRSGEIPRLPLPHPLYEIYIYSPRFEGIHLRSEKVARGGLRWSDRPEDFRREVLGLVKAQKVKNAIIVPSGAKGGFVLKMLPEESSREETFKEGVTCYKQFIAALLGITDNIKDDRIVRPENVVCYDDEDPYLVVAADKGTATFSDIANGISQEFGFWMDDAFASGGKTGYDHKKMGITARGAWESVKRHFFEIGIDFEKDLITVIGIGDMSGDVFGNGLIYSNRLKLVAAFDHRHIFLDPTPDPELSYRERKRLFELPSSSWEDYSKELISPGGGVYKRTAKSIPISEQMKTVLDIKEDALVPNDLIRAILKAPVDLFWNGGIGTYVKAASESHADAGDKANDSTRVNGNELRCKTVGEGGNLGFTQRGRIEYTLNNGIMNTDFIDNSAGVDCSDHEVNLKILLNKEVSEGNLTLEERDTLLREVEEEVAALVLRDNFRQAWMLGYLNRYSLQNMSVYISYIAELEKLKILNSKVEFLPDEKTMLERAAGGTGLTRPELAVLLAYTKINLKSELLKSDVLEDPYFQDIVTEAFPERVNVRYKDRERHHSLVREIKATQLSNRLIDDMGVLFIYCLQIERGATVPDIVRAYFAASAIFDAHEMQRRIEGLDNKIPLSMQYELLYFVRHLVNISARRFLLENRLQGGLNEVIELYAPRVKELRDLTMAIMTGMTQTSLDTLKARFAEAGLPESMATDIGFFRVAYATLNIIEGSLADNLDLSKTAKMYFAVGKHFNLVWFRDKLAEKVQEVSWESLTKLCLRDELDYLQKALTTTLLKECGEIEDAEEAILAWKSKHASRLTSWENMFKVLHESQKTDNSMFFVALRKLGEAINE